MSTLSEAVVVSPEVREAVRSGRAVALESSVVAQGLPPPHNLEVARACAQAVREAGGVPATVVVLDGKLIVGATEEQLARLADPAKKPGKAGARDLAGFLARGGSAGTTVSATSLAARLAGIRVFATGGIGGVHRRALDDEPLDVSGDLAALAGTQVCVVCAGPKAILDVHATAEVLETLGVPVWGWRTGELPLFFTEASGIPLEHRFEDAAAVARGLRLHWQTLGQASGVLLCVAPPRPLPRVQVEEALLMALRDAKAHGLTGKETTPFLLRAVAKHTGGRSIESNLELLVNNARVAGAVAAAWAQGA